MKPDSVTSGVPAREYIPLRADLFNGKPLRPSEIPVPRDEEDDFDDYEEEDDDGSCLECGAGPDSECDEDCPTRDEDDED